MSDQPSDTSRNVDPLDLLSALPTWRQDAACVTEDPERFFPVGSVSSEATALIAEAKAVCASCKVRQQCLDYAMDTGQHDGIWGGMTEDERDSLRRKRQRRTPTR